MGITDDNVNENLSLSYFVKNYLHYNDNDKLLKWQDRHVAFINMIEEAEKQGCKLLNVWMRGKYKWVMLKE